MLGGRSPYVALGTLALTLSLGTALVAPAATGSPGSSRATTATTATGPVSGRAGARTGEPRTTPGFYDARDGAGPAATNRAARVSARVSSSAASTALRGSLGKQGIFEIDGSTGTVRVLEKLDGFLTGPSRTSAAQVALGYVRRHHSALGLTGKDLKTFRLERDYVDITGTHHLSWIQKIGHDKVFSNGLQAAVTRQGRLLALFGSPVSRASSPRLAPSALTTPAAAIAAARRDGHEASQSPGPADYAQAVDFVEAGTTHAAWQTVTMSAANPSLDVFDAATGELLYRRPLAQDDNAPATSRPVARRGGASRGSAYPYFPDAPRGGRQVALNFSQRGWLPPGASRLFGNNSHAYSDVNDNNKPDPSEEAPPLRNGTWNFPLIPFHLGKVSFCGNPYPCTWNPDKPFSWRTNREQNVTQVFSFVNNWHDHLMAAPIGFTEAAGNFQGRNRTGQGVGGDYVDTQTDDGASVDHGLPDGGHVDNANMATPPDGKSPRMQMYLQHLPGTSYPKGDPFAPTDVGDEADTVYHEYTHGLSNRLIVDPSGASTLGGIQAGAMGEAWSDWYAMDYLVARGLQQDVPGKVDVILFQFDGAGVALDRTEPMDCAVGSKDKLCNGGATGHPGGYTYADYARVIGQPEVHSDGEIWAQTLWQLRGQLGSKTTESLVTRAMELAPHNPSYLDMRNAILVSDTAVFGGRHHATIWKVFAARGMGFFAGSLDGTDTSPAASFSRPPTGSRTGVVSGTVTDSAGHPVGGASVTLAFQGRGVVNPTAVTDATGHYRLGPVPQGSYQKIVVNTPGYDPARASVKVGRSATRDFTARRDFAAEGGGARINEFNGPNLYKIGCGPNRALDTSEATGWSSTAGDDKGTPTNAFVPKHLTVQLPQGVNITQFGVDPSAACADGASASTGAYKIETSPNGTTWTTASQGTFTSADDGQLNVLTPTAGAAAVRFVRFTILGNQTPDFATNCPDGAFSGCTKADLTELEVYGTAVP